MLKLLIIIYTYFCIINSNSLEEFKIWGPGLQPDTISLPARYFFVEPLNQRNSTIKVTIDGTNEDNKNCRIWFNTLNRNDGSLIIRYKLYEPCSNIKISIKNNNKHIAESPYLINNIVYQHDCYCPIANLEKYINTWQCGATPPQITKDLGAFKEINFEDIREKIIKRYDRPHSISLCHYVIKSNKIYRKCYGKYVGFNMFMDNILLSLRKRTNFPDLEFFVNLGDWPLSNKGAEILPIFSWCGSSDSHDIIMPTYDITESTLENMGRVTLDMLSVQGNSEKPWTDRIPQLFWRGRDSNQHRLDLIDISRKYPTLFNVSLTNFFFFRDKEEHYGPKTPNLSFFKFFDYKYQLAIDGTVAAYRMPYLLAGGSLIFKPHSNYYEHFYNDLVPYKHYVPVERDLSDLVKKLQWALDNDEEAKQIADNGREYANEHLLPKDIFCYHAQLFENYGKLIKSRVEVLEGMEEIPDKKMEQCECSPKIKDEL